MIGPILMISPRYLPEVYGGAEQQCQRLCQALSERGVEVQVLAGTTEPAGSVDNDLDGVSVVRIRVPASPELGGRYLLATLIWTFRVSMWLHRNGHRFSVFHIHQGKLHALPILLYTFRRKVPVIVKIGNAEKGFDLSRLERKRPFYGRCIAEVLKRRARCFVAISARIREQLLSSGIEESRITSIPNGVHVGIKPEAGANKPFGDQSRTFILLGRVSGQKNPLTVCRAFLSAAKRGLDGYLLVVGDGELLPEIRQFCQHSVGGERIKLLGRRDDVPKLLAGSDFIVLASQSEGLSNALLEAMSFGVVPIASAVSGSTELITPGETGFLFEPADVAALELALIKAGSLDDVALMSMGQACMRRIDKEYRMERVADSYLKLYESLQQQRC